jgi:uncharacterized protein YbaP (TraB family)
MKRIISLFAIALLLAGLFSCASSPARVQSGSPVWKISGNDNTLFLGGSVHILRSNDFPLPKAFDRAFSQSKLLVLEADVEQMADENVAQYLMSKMYLPEGQTLESILDQDTYFLLKLECAKYGLQIESISNYKPSMVITILSVLQIQKFGFVEEGVDTFFQNRAKKEKKSIHFLESVEFQIDMLVSMGEGYENDYVRYSLEDLSTTDNLLADLVNEWKTGNTALTEAMLVEMKEEWPEMYKLMVSNRNAAWMPQIEEYLASGQTAFVIVGAAHLYGPDGLLVQLENSGYVVEPFK